MINREASAVRPHATLLQPERQLTAAQRKARDVVRNAVSGALSDTLSISTPIAQRAEAVKPAAKGAWGAFTGFLGGAKDAVVGAFSSTKAFVVDVVKHPGEKLQQAFEWGRVKVDTVILGATHDKYQTIEDVDDPSDVNDPSRSDVDAAKQAYAANRAQERAARAKLSTADQAKYDALAKRAEGSAIAQRGLQRLLIDGQLTNKADLRGEQHLLDRLNGLATQDLDAAIDRDTLLQQVIAEVENPVRINQHGKGTCGATTAQILLIRSNPAEYVRLVAGLSAPAGTVQMKGGHFLNRPGDWDAQNDSGRSTSSRLFQSAVMEEGQPIRFAHYDNTEDTTKILGVSISGGLTSGGLTNALDQLTGQDYDATAAWAWNRGAVYDELVRRVGEGQGPIPVSLTWGDSGGHFVQVDKIADGKVTYTNPWGLVQSMSVDEFKAHLTTVIAPKR